MRNMIFAASKSHDLIDFNYCIYKEHEGTFEVEEHINGIRQTQILSGKAMKRKFNDIIQSCYPLFVKDSLDTPGFIKKVKIDDYVKNLFNHSSYYSSRKIVLEMMESSYIPKK